MLIRSAQSQVGIYIIAAPRLRDHLGRGGGKTVKDRGQGGLEVMGALYL